MNKDVRRRGQLTWIDSLLRIVECLRIGKWCIPPTYSSTAHLDTLLGQLPETGNHRHACPVARTWLHQAQRTENGQTRTDRWSLPWSRRKHPGDASCRHSAQDDCVHCWWHKPRRDQPWCLRCATGPTHTFRNQIAFSCSVTQWQCQCESLSQWLIVIGPLLYKTLIRSNRSGTTIVSKICVYCFFLKLFHTFSTVMPFCKTG